MPRTVGTSDETGQQALRTPAQLRVRAIHDYSGEADGDLKLQRGDIIQVTQKHADGWWEGSLPGQQGKFPINFVTVGLSLVVSPFSLIFFGDLSLISVPPVSWWFPLNVTFVPLGVRTTYAHNTTSIQTRTMSCRSRPARSSRSTICRKPHGWKAERETERLAFCQSTIPSGSWIEEHRCCIILSIPRCSLHIG